MRTFSSTVSGFDSRLSLSRSEGLHAGWEENSEEYFAEKLVNVREQRGRFYHENENRLNQNINLTSGDRSLHLDLTECMRWMSSATRGH